MTRFWITLEEGVKFVIQCLEQMKGGEIFVPKIPSVKIMDLARAIAPKAQIRIVGIRNGEKLHEFLINRDEARFTKDVGKHFIIEPEFVSWEKRDYANPHKGNYVEDDFFYASNSNNEWLTIPQIKQLLEDFL